jgi:hypothetical protein
MLTAAGHTLMDALQSVKQRGVPPRHLAERPRHDASHGKTAEGVGSLAALQPIQPHKAAATA